MTVAEQKRFENKFIKTDTCWIWQTGKTTQGYGRFWLSGKTQYAHRLSYQLYIGPIPNGLCVCHYCDNPACVNPSHLFLDTSMGNTKDRHNKNRDARQTNETNGQAILTEPQVQIIRTKYKEGAIQTELAKEFGVARTTIFDIVNYKTWINLRPHQENW